MKKIFLAIALLLLFSCKDWVVHYYFRIKIDNKSADTISYYYPGGMGVHAGIYPDTTLLSIYEHMVYYIEPGKRSDVRIESKPLVDWVLSFPRDTVSFFFFNRDTLAKYSWMEVQQGYKIMQRYDLSLQDLQKLSDEHRHPVITFPPTEIMKDMKMYPPYGKYISQGAKCH